MQQFRTEVEEWFKDFQDRLCRDLEKCDGKARFEEDLWQREGGGGGRTRVIQNGAVFEKGGVNFSAVEGELPESALTVLHMPDRRFFCHRRFGGNAPGKPDGAHNAHERTVF